MVRRDLSDAAARQGKRRRKSLAALSPRHSTPGTSPGAGIRLAAGERRRPPGLLAWSAGALVARDDASLAECAEARSRGDTTWVHLQGSPDPDGLAALAEAFGLHRLAVEDVAHGRERPKLDVHGEQLFLVLLLPHSNGGHIELRQVSLFVGDNWLISFCAGAEDPFGPVRERILAEPAGNIRRYGIDYLLYALVDLVVDHGFPVLEDCGTRLELLEEEILERPAPEGIEQIQEVKRELLILRKAFWPQREVLSLLSRDTVLHVTNRTLPYLRDCYDHAVQILELMESYREMVSGLHDLYLSGISKRMNDIMKVLTIIATLFMPLSFLAAVWGMNFNAAASPWNMPELNWYFGYPLALLLMLVVAVGMLAFFRHKRWL